MFNELNNWSLKIGLKIDQLVIGKLWRNVLKLWKLKRNEVIHAWQTIQVQLRENHRIVRL